MDVNTIQMAKWRRAKELNIELLDTTVKSGIPAFAPTWNLVMDHKQDKISDEVYIEKYRKLMQDSFMVNQFVWIETMRKPHIAIACYCHPDRFCHRHLLVKFFESVCQAKGIPFRYLGEIE